MPNNTYNKSTFFSIHGRIGRLRFVTYELWTYFLFFSSITFVAALAGTMSGNIIGVLLSLVIIKLGIIFMLIFAIRRLNDLNLTGWLCLITFLPLVNLIFYAALIFMPGNNLKNDYGQCPPKNPPLIWLHLFAPILLSILSTILLLQYM